MRMAENDLDDLHEVMGAAKIELARFPEDKARSDGTEAFASSSAANRAPRGASDGAGPS